MIGKLFKGKKPEESGSSAASSGHGKSKTSPNKGEGSGKNASKQGRSNASSSGKGPSNKSSSGKSDANKGASAQSKSDGNRSSNRRRRSRGGNKKPWDIAKFAVPEVEGKTRFHDFGLPNDLMHAIADLKFEYCSPIQAQSLPYALNGQDVVGKAQTGTGKTAAFLVAIIDDLLNHPIAEERYAGEARALILAPTRELVIQIAEDAKLLTKYTDLEVHTLVGGMDYGKQQDKLREKFVDILVATPGRLLDFAGNQDVHLDQVEVLVIDEADRMLDMGFIPQIRRIVRQTPQKVQRQTLMFSATFTDDVLNLVEQWTVDPVRIEIQPESVATDRVKQHVYLASTEEKFTLLYNILQQDDVDNLIVFSNRRDECRRLYDRLKAHGFKVGLLSGEIAQNRRVKTLDGFKTGQLKVLVATDVAGRGIHIDGISHVVNFTLPEEPEDYVHRIGRTGRAGKNGTSISFACEDDAFRLMPIQDLVGETLKCEQPPEALLAEAPHVEVPKEQRRRSNQRPRSRR
ncbi:ATP-dependent RNA helicase RhlB [Aurantivibrio plasticivorans]